MVDPIVKWPFVSIVDSRGDGIGWAVVNARIVSPERQQLLADLRRAGIRLVGMSSDMAFPLVDEPDLLDYGALCEAWCHCFRAPDHYLPDHLPRALLSASDFTDPHRVAPEQVGGDRPGQPRYDFIYVGATEPWKAEAKNWALARRCIPRLCRDLGLRALVVAAPPDLPDSPQVSQVPPLPWTQLLAHLTGARFLFLPNERDASPRLLAEALCLDVPVVVNRRILGGWKYVNPFTGVFFDGEADLSDAVATCLGRRTSPRRWFCANHGPYLAGQRLLALLRRVDPSIRERSHLALLERAALSRLPALRHSPESEAPLPSASSGSRPASSSDPTNGGGRRGA